MKASSIDSITAARRPASSRFAAPWPLSRVATRELSLFALPAAVYVLHALLFRDWIIDDAGISYVYARNLADGHGLVSQPGVEPVEGYSNFLWVMLLAPFFALDVFDPVVIPKLLSALCVFGGFLLLTASLRRLGVKRVLVTLALLLTAMNTSFVVWTTSGLENGLLFLLVAALFAVCGHAGEEGWQLGALAGLTASAIAMTRPDGIVYAAAFPIVLAVAITTSSGSRRAATAQLLAFAAVFAIAFGCFMAFRWLYFGELLPNTYYAKAGTSLPSPSFLPRVLDLLSSIAGGLGLLVLIAATFGVYQATRRRALDLGAFVVGLFVALSALTFVLLPRDWMGYHRFATPFIPFAYLWLVVLAAATLRGTKRSVSHGVSLAAIAILTSALLFGVRSASFHDKPTVPFQSVAAAYGRHYDEEARRLEVEDATVLLSDLGGVLYYANLRVYDLAGLTDHTIARTLADDQQRFHDYVFEVVRPTFIHTHMPWTQLASFDDDARFRRDYEPVAEFLVPGETTRLGRPLMAGDYVRKEVLRPAAGVD